MREMEFLRVSQTARREGSMRSSSTKSVRSTSGQSAAWPLLDEFGNCERSRGSQDAQAVCYCSSCPLWYSADSPAGRTGRPLHLTLRLRILLFSHSRPLHSLSGAVSDLRSLPARGDLQLPRRTPHKHSLEPSRCFRPHYHSFRRRFFVASTGLLDALSLPSFASIAAWRGLQHP
jgi:hypothetical protein